LKVGKGDLKRGKKEFELKKGGVLSILEKGV